MATISLTTQLKQLNFMLVLRKLHQFLLWEYPSVMVMSFNNWAILLGNKTCMRIGKKHRNFSHDHKFENYRVIRDLKSEKVITCLMLQRNKFRNLFSSCVCRLSVYNEAHKKEVVIRTLLTFRSKVEFPIEKPSLVFIFNAEWEQCVSNLI